MTNLFGALDIEIWNLFVFWCLYFGIWHSFWRLGASTTKMATLFLL